VPSLVLRAVRSQRRRPGSGGAGWVRVWITTAFSGGRHAQATGRASTAACWTASSSRSGAAASARSTRASCPTSRAWAPGTSSCSSPWSRRAPHTFPSRPYPDPTLHIPFFLPLYLERCHVPHHGAGAPRTHHPPPFAYPCTWNMVISSLIHHGGTPRTHSPPHLAYLCTLGTRQHTVPALSAVCCVSVLVQTRECVTCVSTCTQAKRYIREWS